MSEYQLQWISTQGQWLKLQSEWQGVCERDGRGHPFFDWMWCWHWWQQYARSDWRLMIGIVYRDGIAVGIMPWYTHVQRSVGMSFVVISSIGANEISPPWLDVIGSREDWREIPPKVILEELTAVEWNIIDHNPILPDSNFAACISPLFDAERLEVVNCEVSPFISSPGNLDDWVKSLGSNTRKDIRRKRNLLSNHADLKVVRHHSQPAVTAAIPQLIELNQLRLKVLNKHGAFHLPSFTEFHRKLAPLMAMRGACEIYELRLGNWVVASQLYYGAGSTRYSYLSGMDPKAADLGPGGVLDGEIFAQLMANPDVKAIDLGIGDQEYKMRYGATRRTAFRYTIFRNSFLRQLALMRRSWLRQIPISLSTTKGDRH